MHIIPAGVGGISKIVTLFDKPIYNSDKGNYIKQAFDYEKGAW